jgi:RsiW-degrading membrane proteinase PrsW (M82 family)
VSETVLEQKRTHHGASWWRILLIGLALYAVGVILLLLTQNPNLFPTVVLIGNFIVPAAYVSFFYERRHLSEVTMGTTAMTFLWGGLLGVFAASLLEPLIIHGMSFPHAFLVGLVEEFVKILGVLVIARHRRHDSEMDGLVLGAAAGMGFAALESMGYAFTAFLASQGSISATVGITLMRGVLAPVGHGTWTALLVSVLFREGRREHFRITGRVLGAYLLVVVLHGFWDGLPILLSALFGQGLDVFIGQLIVGAIGVVLLVRRWHEARRRQDAEREAASQPIPGAETGVAG